MNIQFIEKYGPFELAKTYKVLQKGYDWIKLNCKHKIYYVPLCLIKRVL